MSKILGDAELNWAGQRDDLVVRTLGVWISLNVSKVADAEKNEIVNNITMLRKKLDETRDLYNKKDLEMMRMKVGLMILCWN